MKRKWLITGIDIKLGYVVDYNYLKKLDFLIDENIFKLVEVENLYCTKNPLELNNNIDIQQKFKNIKELKKSNIFKHFYISYNHKDKKLLKEYAKYLIDAKSLIEVKLINYDPQPQFEVIEIDLRKNLERIKTKLKKLLNNYPEFFI